MNLLTVFKFPVQRRSPLGFTLLELLVVIALAGIMAAIAAPGMLGFVNRAKINKAHTELFGMLISSQREAVKISKNCTVTLATGASPTISSSCMSTESKRTLQEAQLNYSNALVTSNQIVFNFKGETDSTLTTDLLMVLSSTSGSRSHQRCIVISKGIGLIRQGNYPANDTSLDPLKCIPN